jgi:hypothetical protein
MFHVNHAPRPNPEPAPFVLKRVNRVTDLYRPEASLAFLGAANDIAVSVESICAMPGVWANKVPVQQTLTDHIRYLSSVAG